MNHENEIRRLKKKILKQKLIIESLTDRLISSTKHKKRKVDHDENKKVKISSEPLVAKNDAGLSGEKLDSGNDDSGNGYVLLDDDEFNQIEPQKETIGINLSKPPKKSVAKENYDNSENAKNQNTANDHGSKSMQAPLSFSIDDNKNLAPIEVDFLRILDYMPSPHKGFKNNMGFDELLMYLRTLNIPLFRGGIFTMPKQLKNFIYINHAGIHKFLIENLNKSLHDSCLLAYVLSKESDFSKKLLLFHDVVLFIDDFSKLVFLFACVFSKKGSDNQRVAEIKDNSGNWLYQTMRMILENQLIADKDLFLAPQSLEAIQKIKATYNLDPQYHDFHKSAATFASAKTVNEVCATRIVAHYMDWDWSYNHMIVSTLYPKYVLTKDQHILYLIGVVASNGYRTIGLHESVKGVYDFLENEGNIGLYFVRHIKNVDVPEIKDFDRTLMKCIF